MHQYTSIQTCKATNTKAYDNTNMHIYEDKNNQIDNYTKNTNTQIYQYTIVHKYTFTPHTNKQLYTYTIYLYKTEHKHTSIHVQLHKDSNIQI